ncbi:MAG: SPASM domain-containing protein, partial [Gammaproteobacteria bacterium]|nr:SPASM domain-containing protein [Gammaproteobacteria bacterium]
AGSEGRGGGGAARADLLLHLHRRQSRHLVAFLETLEPLAPSQVFVSQLNYITAGMAAAHNAVTGPDWHVTVSNLGDMTPESYDLEVLYADLQAARAWAAAPGRPAVLFSPDIGDRHTLEVFYREPLTFVGGRRCTDPLKMMMIRTDGSVIPAHGRCYAVVVGNAHETPLRDIWAGEPFQQFRATLAAAGGTLPACARCCGIIGKPAEQGA